MLERDTIDRLMKKREGEETEMQKWTQNLADWEMQQSKRRYGLALEREREFEQTFGSVKKNWKQEHKDAENLRVELQRRRRETGERMMIAMSIEKKKGDTWEAPEVFSWETQPTIPQNRISALLPPLRAPTCTKNDRYYDSSSDSEVEVGWDDDHGGIYEHKDAQDPLWWAK